MPAARRPLARHWVTDADLPGLGVITDGEALAYHAGPTPGVVRRTRAGQFAVIILDGPRRRVARILPTLAQARAYMHAITR